MRAVSIRQPWAWAIARGHRPVTNQDVPTAYRGPMLVHASMRVDLSSCHSPLIRSAGWDPADPLATLGAVIAVAELTGVCSPGEVCECGPWAEEGSHHWRISGVRALPRPVVALGRLGLWEPSAGLISNVHTMLALAP
jgi:hypothetical protein